MPFSFESHIPKNVVDQMNDILVQDIHLLDYSALGRVSDVHDKQSAQATPRNQTDTLTCPLEHP